MAEQMLTDDNLDYWQFFDIDFDLPVQLNQPFIPEYAIPPF